MCSPSTIADRVLSRKESRSFGYGGFGVVDTTKNLRAIERENERERERRENASKKGVFLLLGEEEEKNWS